MATIVYRDQKIDGRVLRAGMFLPQHKHLDERKVRQAEMLNAELKLKVGRINKEFERLAIKNAQPRSSTEKWAWLGLEVGKLLPRLKYLDEEDIHNNAIWPAINQYLDSELKKDSNPEMGGGVKDHSRRCYYFVKYGFHEFLPNWSAWSELADRGDQLIHNESFRNSIRSTFGHDRKTLTVKDYREIVKLLAEHWPSNIQERVALEHVNTKKIEKDIRDIYAKWAKNKKISSGNTRSLASKRDRK